MAVGAHERRGWRWCLAAVAISALLHQVMSATAKCSASADALWQAKCPTRTAANKNYLPMTNVDEAEINIDDKTIVDEYENARLEALKLSGTLGRAAMSGMRRKSQEWYKNSLRGLLTYFCMETTSTENLERCVAPSSPYAARLIDNSCVVVKDNASCHDQSMCERRSNCKWDDAIQGASSRRAFFSSADATAAKKWVERDYPTSFAGFLAPGIVFTVLGAVSCVGFLVLRCVFNQCGGRNPDEKGYSRCDILIPTIIFAVCSFCVFICSIVTVAQNTNITDGVTNILDSLNVTLENIDIFADNLHAPLVEARIALMSASLVVAEEVKDMEWIDKDAAVLRSMIETYGRVYLAQGPYPFKNCDAKNGTCVVCPDAVCGKDLQRFLQLAGVTLNSTSGSASESVKSLQDAFIQRTTVIGTSLAVAGAQIGQVANMTSSSKRTVDEIKTTFDDYSFSRGGLVMFVFLLGLLSSSLGLFGIIKGICTKKSSWVQLLHASWMIGSLVCIVGFVLSSSLLAVGAVWYDSCNYLNIIRTDSSPYFPSLASSVVNACFNDSSLLQPLGLEDHLAFSCSIDDSYATLGKTDFAAFPASVAAFGEIVTEFDLKTFGFNSSMSRDLVKKANAAMTDVGVANGFTQENVLKPWDVFGENVAAARDVCTDTDVTDDTLPTCYVAAKCEAGTGPVSSKDKCKLAFVHAYQYILAFDKISTTLDEMREDLLGDTGKDFSAAWKFDKSLMEFATSYYQRLADVKTSTLDTLMKDQVGKVLENIEKVRCSGSCGWINISYNAVYTGLCQDVLGTTLAISLSVLFLCLFLIPMVVSGVILQKRLRGAKKGSYEQLELRLHALENKAKEEARAKSGSQSGSSKKIELFSFKKNLNSA